MGSVSAIGQPGLSRLDVNRPARRFYIKGDRRADAHHRGQVIERHGIALIGVDVLADGLRVLIDRGAGALGLARVA